MAISPLAMKAYLAAADMQGGGLTGFGSKKSSAAPGMKSFEESLAQINETQGEIGQSFYGLNAEKRHYLSNSNSFTATIEDSLGKVNEMQIEKGQMIEEFASGKSQNVHELMISLQKAGLAMDMTSAVRNKVMNAYQELMRIQF